MVVYGDPEDGRTFGDLIDKFHKRCQGLDWDSLDEVRHLLIQAGEMEQGLADFWEASQEFRAKEVASIQRMTDLAAQAFCELYLSTALSPGYQARQELTVLALKWRQAPAWLRETTLRIKVPEGFAFYGVFPEQYILSAREWGGQQEEAKAGILVIGVRSIGTTLSAVVRATLALLQKTACRITVRPCGHPYHREARIAPEWVKDYASVLIVDEGPGASGSSMASVAQAVSRAGIDREKIYFFPSHNHAPGGAASPEVLRWWHEITRITTPPEQLKWEGHSIEAMLLQRANEYVMAGPPCLSIIDVSAGEWRRYAFNSEAEWPAACIRFERRKFLCAGSAGRKVFWKFSGLHDANSELQVTETTVRRPRRLGSCCGYTAFEWIQGTRLTPSAQSDLSLLEKCADYVVNYAGPGLSRDEASRSYKRLSDMLYWNIKEALGAGPAEQAHSLRPEEETIKASYSDGRMAPWEWVIGPGGELYKIHDCGRDRDHTVVGRQSLLWDVAGFITEWELRNEAQQVFLDVLRKRGFSPRPESLRFYRLAYAAFQLGQTCFCASMDQAETTEKNRLAGAAQQYRRQVEELLLPDDSEKRSTPAAAVQPGSC